jgi:hypothetical protein
MTEIRALPTAWALLEEALRARRPIQVSYHGRQRLICPHALGWSTQARPIVLGYQTGGETSTGILPADPRRRWRCMFVDEIDQVIAAEKTSAWGTADNYNARRPFAITDDVAVAVTPAGQLPARH